MARRVSVNRGQITAKMQALRNCAQLIDLDRCRRASGRLEQGKAAQMRKDAQ